ncbi:hypothetical protein MFLAVUS_009074 [Mucor flavus]|uniref:Uncharacterized protein n=1 Tax=Mucor flavus TaxID=439312 RepID=A0ABP9Z914_9FUNG
MKASIAFRKCVNLVALSGYLLNIIGLLDSTSEPLQKVNGVFHIETNTGIDDFIESFRYVYSWHINLLNRIIYVLIGSCQSCVKPDEVIAGIEEPSSSTYVFHSPAIHPDLPQYTVKDNTRPICKFQA